MYKYFNKDGSMKLGLENYKEYFTENGDLKPEVLKETQIMSKARPAFSDATMFYYLFVWSIASCLNDLDMFEEVFLNEELGSDVTTINPNGILDIIEKWNNTTK